MPSVISNEVFTHLWRLKDAAYEIAGISQLSATSKKPAGLESGIALQTVLDVETRRFAVPSKEWESAAKRSAEKFIEVAKRIHKDEKPLKVFYRGKDFVKTINWADVNMKDDQYVLQVWPTNLLPKTPSGKLDAVDKLIQRGMVDQRQGLALLDFPDIERFRSLETAPMDDIDAAISAMLVDGKYMQPLEYQDLQLGLQRVTFALTRAKLDGAPEDRLELLERWLDEATSMLQPEPSPESMMQSPQIQNAPGEAGAVLQAPMAPPPQAPPQMPM
jgi:hypothetical protein